MFRRKKKTLTITEAPQKPTDLEVFFKEDKETYKMLQHSMFLDPRKITISMEDAAEEARKFEKDKDLIRARAMYEIAGGLAIYKGNAEKVAEYFGKCEKILPDVKYPILKDPEKAVARAREFYEKYLKS